MADDMRIGCRLGCGKIGGTRGLCSSHLKELAQQVLLGRTTWAALEADGKCVPLKEGPFRMEQRLGLIKKRHAELQQQKEKDAMAVTTSTGLDRKEVHRRIESTLRDLGPSCTEDLVKEQLTTLGITLAPGTFHYWRKKVFGEKAGEKAATKPKKVKPAREALPVPAEPAQTQVVQASVGSACTPSDRLKARFIFVEIDGQIPPDLLSVLAQAAGPRGA